MADDPKSGGFANNSAIVLAALSMGALLFNQYAPPLQGARPKSESFALYAPQDPQDVPARLWQDPFEAVAKAVVQANSSKSNAGTACRHKEPVEQLWRANILTSADIIYVNTDKDPEKVIVIADRHRFFCRLQLVCLANL